MTSSEKEGLENKVRLSAESGLQSIKSGGGERHPSLTGVAHRETRETCQIGGVMELFGTIVMVIGVGLVFGGLFLTVSVGQMRDKDREDNGHGPKGQGR